ncbi:retropepsin-like aspartic protease [Pseudobacteroides cellulosolvens]|nr:retropepsin-like aspartic protease [Pseudobacteroides cellulosolvens]
MAGGAAIMINISSKDGLIYVDATLMHGDRSITIKNALVDTGSSATVISRDIAHSLGMRPEPTDIINSVQGIGGSESVVEKKIDAISLDDVAATNFDIQVGAMNYGIDLDAIIGLDLLTACKVVMNLEAYTLTALKE